MIVAGQANPLAGTSATLAGSLRMAIERMVRASGLALAASFDGGGDRMPVVLLHADLGSRAQWQPVFERLARERPVASFDRRGHGRSSTPADGRFDYADEVADLAAIADAAGFERFVAVGHSGGGAAAYLFAQCHPDRVAGLLLVDPARSATVMPEEARHAAIEQTRAAPKPAATAFYSGLVGDHPDVLRQVTEGIRATRDATITGMVEALGRFEPEQVARRYGGPALALVATPDEAPALLHCIAGYPHLVIAGAGHWIQLADPGAFDAALDRFLAQVDAGNAMNRSEAAAQ